MASDGLLKRAKTGICRMCQRTRKTDDQVKAVGEVHHGFATGHIWECINTEDCDKKIQEKLKDEKVNDLTKARIQTALKVGRFTYYVFMN